MPRSTRTGSSSEWRGCRSDWIMSHRWRRGPGYAPANSGGIRSEEDCVSALVSRHTGQTEKRDPDPTQTSEFRRNSPRLSAMPSGRTVLRGPAPIDDQSATPRIRRTTEPTGAGKTRGPGGIPEGLFRVAGWRKAGRGAGGSRSGVAPHNISARRATARTLTRAPTATARAKRRERPGFPRIPKDIRCLYEARRDTPRVG